MNKSRDDLLEEVSELRRSSGEDTMAIHELVKFIGRVRGAWYDEGSIDKVLDLLDSEAYDLIRKYDADQVPD